MIKNFRNAVNQLVAMLVGGVVDGVGHLSNTISEALENAKKARKRKGYDVHHIVAQIDRRADYSRYLLKECKIDINSPYNLVKISKTLHMYLHTSGYHAAVSIVISTCYFSKHSFMERKYSVIAGLVFIGALLRSASSSI